MHRVAHQEFHDLGDADRLAGKRGLGDHAYKGRLRERATGPAVAGMAPEPAGDRLVVLVPRPSQGDQRIGVEQMAHARSSIKSLTWRALALGVSGGRSKTHAPFFCFIGSLPAVPRWISSDTAWPSLRARACAYACALAKASSSIVRVVRMMSNCSFDAF